MELSNTTAMYTSPDAVTWTGHTPTSQISTVIWAGTRYVGVVGGLIHTSLDGVTWVLEDSGPTTLYELAWDGVRTIAVANNGVVRRTQCVAPEVASGCVRLQPSR